MRPTTPLRSAVYGHLIGDAFGVPYEFMAPARLPARLTWRGFGTHNQPPGTWSDDGALMLCLLASLTERGQFDPADVGARFVAWLDGGYMAAGEQVFDVGTTTHDAIDRLARGVPPLTAGSTADSSNGNGALMRVLPLALWARRLPIPNFLQLLHDCSRLTHGHACSQACCGVYGLLLRHLLDGGDRSTAWPFAVEAARAAYAGDPLLGPPYLRELARIEGFGSCKGSGFVVDCLVSAWTAVRDAVDTEDALCRAVRYGHDTDTTAAVAGSLAGVALGLGEQLTRWGDELRLTPTQRTLIETFVAQIDEH